MTGIVNIIINTLDASPGLSYSVLVAYSLAVTSSAIFAHKHNVTIKFW